MSAPLVSATAAPALHRLSDAAAVLTLAAVAAALALADPYAAVPAPLRPGAWSQDTISAPVALALLAVNARVRRGWQKGWLLWAGLVGYLIYAYGLYAFDRVMNPVYPLYLAILSFSAFAAFLFLRVAQPSALRIGPHPPPRRGVALLFALLLVLFGALWLVQLLPAMAARAPLPGQTIFVLDLAFALPLVGLTALLLWRGSPAGDLLAIPMLMKVAVLGVSVFLGTVYTWAFFGGPLLPFDLALYAVMGFGPAALILPVWRGLEAAG